MVRLAPDSVTADSEIDAVLFDFRGTLFGDEDDMVWIRSAAAGIGRALGDAEIEAFLAQGAVVSEDPEIKALLDRCDTALDVHRDANLRWLRAVGVDDELAIAIWARDGHPDATFAFPDAAPVMAALREQGIRIAVVSDIHYDIRDHFRRHDLDQYVDVYVLSFEHGCQKPDAEMFTRALDALGVTADRALMVGDTPGHDGGAASVGIATYILPGPFRSGHRGTRGLDAVLRLVGIAS
jgi:putative hydrolase of the HAD superfamily